MSSALGSAGWHHPVGVRVCVCLHVRTVSDDYEFLRLLALHQRVSVLIVIIHLHINLSIQSPSSCSHGGNRTIR